MHLRGCNFMVLKGPMGTIYIYNIHTHLINYIDNQMIAYVVFHSGNISSKGVCKRLQTFRSFSRAFNLQTLILKPGLKKCFSGLKSSILDGRSFSQAFNLQTSILKPGLKKCFSGLKSSVLDGRRFSQFLNLQ